MAAAADPEDADRFRAGHRHARRQRRSGATVRRRDAHVRRQRVDARPLLLRRRRRAADRAAARPLHRAHRARRPATSRPARSAWCRAASSSASSCRTAPRAATSARTTARTFACPSSARSARTAWPTRATFWRRSPPSRIATATFGSWPNSAAGSGRPRSTIRRSISSPGTATTCRSSTTSPLQHINTVSYDHPDPSIYCVLASPSAVAGHGEHGVRR